LYKKFSALKYILRLSTQNDFHPTSPNPALGAHDFHPEVTFISPPSFCFRGARLSMPRNNSHFISPLSEKEVKSRAPFKAGGGVG